MNPDEVNVGDTVWTADWEGNLLRVVVVGKGQTADDEPCANIAPAEYKDKIFEDLQAALKEFWEYKIYRIGYDDICRTKHESMAVAIRRLEVVESTEIAKIKKIEQSLSKIREKLIEG